MAAAAAAAPSWAAGTAAVAEEYIGCFPVRMHTAGMPSILKKAGSIVEVQHYTTFGQKQTTR